MNTADLEALVAALPELYQPLHGHPEFTAAAQRPCADRLADIVAVHDGLADLLGRPLRVLDLGCAQGFFSLALAQRGAEVRGIDADSASIALCRALAAEDPGLAARFEVATVESVLDALAPGEVDLVLGLSIFHHLVHEHGADDVRARLAALGDGVAACIVEVALAGEPLYWAPAQPADPRALFEGFAFCHELSRHGTHLSAIERPLLVASRSHWVLPPEAGVIDAHLAEPHAFAKGHYRGSRRYFRSGDRLVKLFRYDVDPAFDNAGELAREAAILQAPPPGFPVPAFHAFGETAVAGWLIREWLPGTLLSERLGQQDDALARRALAQLLAQLAALESAGLFHEDLRVWNLLDLDDGQIRLIDYGSIREHAQDRAWPGNPWLAFVILVHELVNADLAHPEPLRTAGLSPWGLPAPYRQWLAAFWERPFSEWSFSRLGEALAGLPAEVPAQDDSGLPEKAWQHAVEQGLTALSRHGDYLQWRVQQHSAAEEGRVYALRKLRERIDEAARERLALRDESAAQAERLATLEEAAEQLRHELFARSEALEALTRERDALLASASWRVTAPLRVALDAAARLPARLGYLGRAGLHRLAHFVLQRPRLRTLGLRLLARVPRLERWLQRALLSGGTPRDDDGEPQGAPPPDTLRRARRALGLASDPNKQQDHP